MTSGIGRTLLLKDLYGERARIEVFRGNDLFTAAYTGDSALNMARNLLSKKKSKNIKVDNKE